MSRRRRRRLGFGFLLRSIRRRAIAARPRRRAYVCPAAGLLDFRGNLRPDNRQFLGVAYCHRPLPEMYEEVNRNRQDGRENQERPDLALHFILKALDECLELIAEPVGEEEQE